MTGRSVYIRAATERRLLGIFTPGELAALISVVPPQWGIHADLTSLSEPDVEIVVARSR